MRIALIWLFLCCVAACTNTISGAVVEAELTGAIQALGFKYSPDRNVGKCAERDAKGGGLYAWYGVRDRSIHLCLLNVPPFRENLVIRHEMIHAAQQCRFSLISNLPDIKPLVTRAITSWGLGRPETGPDLIRKLNEMNAQEQEVLREKYTDRQRPFEREARSLGKLESRFVIKILQQACKPGGRGHPSLRRDVVKCRLQDRTVVVTSRWSCENSPGSVVLG